MLIMRVIIDTPHIIYGILVLLLCKLLVRKLMCACFVQANIPILVGYVVIDNTLYCLYIELLPMRLSYRCYTDGTQISF